MALTSFCASVCPSVGRAPYLRNRTSSNHRLWYTCVKWWYLQDLFLFFQSFDFQGFQWGKRAKYSPKRQKNYFAFHISGNTSYDCHLWYTSVKWYLEAFFRFFKILSPSLFLSFFQNFDMLNCQESQRSENGPKWQKILFVAPDISGTKRHMIFIYSTHV